MKETDSRLAKVLMGVGVAVCVAASLGASLRAHAVEGEAGAPAGPSDRVTINLSEAELKDVLNMFSQQTGRSIVIGPSVTNRVNVRLSDTPWEEALDVILKPYGYGYKLMGSTIVVQKLKELSSLEAEEPLVSEVFHLKYLDAADMVTVITNQLSPGRGSVAVLRSQEEMGWEFTGRRRGAAAQGGAGIGEKRERVAGAEKVKKSKTIIVRDIPSVIQTIRKILGEIDRMPAQILIEARFVEVKSDFLQDIGFDWGTGATGAENPGVQPTHFRGQGGMFGLGAQQLGGGVQPAAFTPASGSSLAFGQPFNAGLSMKFQQLTDVQFEVLLHMLQEEDSVNILSAPRVLTLNNQEASINVGQRLPIIKSDVSGTTATAVSTSLEYYENIGIQLNVVPQVCGDNYISLIVHPAVTDKIGEEQGVVLTATEQEMPLTRYPVLTTREAETQIIIKSGSTVVIGGLLKNRDAKTQLKVPVLGDIPILGQLFRRDTVDKEKLDLLIFLTATVMPSLEEAGEQAAAAAESARVGAEQTAKAVALARAEAEQAAALEREARLKAEETARVQSQARVAAERKAAEAAGAQAAAEQARLAAEKRAQAEAEARAEAESKARRRAERAQLAAEQRAREEAEVKREAERRAQAEAEKVRLAAEKKARAEAEARAAAEREAQARAAAAAEQARIAAAERAKEEAAVRAEAEAKAKRVAEKARLAAEKKARAEAEAKLEAEREAQAKAEKAKIAAEKKAKAEAKARAEAEQEARERAEEARLAAEKKAQKEAAKQAESQRIARERAALEAEKARQAAAEKARAEARARAKAEQEAREQAEKARLAVARKSRLPASGPIQPGTPTDAVRLPPVSVSETGTNAASITE